MPSKKITQPNKTTLFRIYCIVKIFKTHRGYNLLTRKSIAKKLKTDYGIYNLKTDKPVSEKQIGRDINDYLIMSLGAPIDSDNSGYMLTDKNWEFEGWESAMDSFEKDEVQALMLATEIITEQYKEAPAILQLERLTNALKARCSSPIPEKLSEQEKENYLGEIKEAPKIEKASAYLEFEAREHFSNKRYSECVRVATQVLEFTKKNASILLERSFANYFLGDMKGAVNDATMLLKDDPNNLFAIAARAYTYSNTNQHEKALVDAKKIEKLLSGDDPLLFRVFGMFICAKSHFYLSSFREALSFATQALMLTPDDTDFLNIRSDSNWYLCRFEDAIMDATFSLQLSPNQPYPLYIRSKAYARLKLFEEAICDATSALKLHPKNPTLLCLRGTAHYGLKDIKKMKRDILCALEINPEHELSLKIKNARIF